MCSPKSNYLLTSDLYNVIYKLSMVENPLQKFGLVIIKPPKTNISIPLWTSYYMPQNQKTESVKLKSNIKINSESYN